MKTHTMLASMLALALAGGVYAKETHTIRALLQQEQTAMDRMLESVSADPDEATLAAMEAQAAKLNRAAALVAALDHSERMKEIPEEEKLKVLFGLSGSEQKNVERFSLLRFFSGVQSNNLTGVEREMSDHAAEEAARAGVQLSGAGLSPMVIAVLRSRFRNDMTATGGSGGNQGGTFIPTVLRDPLGPLFERAITAQMGATVLTGLTTNIGIPTYGDTAAQAAKTENANADEVTSATGLLSMAPRRLPVVLDISKQLSMQTGGNVDLWMYNQLITRYGLRVDDYAINGSGTAPQPFGVRNTVGIGGVIGGTNGAAPTWAHIIALETAVSNANADVGTLGYCTNPSVRGKLLGTEKFSGTGQTVWADNNTVRGYRTGVSTILPANLTKGTSSACSPIIFGNWADLIMGSWGGLDVENVTDRANAVAGLKSIVVTGFFDSLVQRPQSFSAMLDALTA